MANQFTIQSNFSLGQIGPLLYGRTDFDGYYRGARTVENLVPIPQGGVTRRFGTNFVVDITNSLTDSDELKGTILQYAVGTDYVIIFRPLAIDIYRDGTLLDTVVTTYTASDIIDLDFSAQDKRLVVVHPDFAPQLLSRAKADETSWGITALAFKNKPTTNVETNISTFTFTLSAKTGSTVTITSSSAVFTSDMVGGLFYGTGGIMRLNTYTSSTVMVGATLAGFDFTKTTVTGDLAVLREPVFNSTYGWPKHVSFFQDRLILSGNNKYPAGVYFSNINDYANFNDSIASDSANGISTYVRAAQGGTVQAMLPTTTVNVFSSGGVFTSQNSVDAPITPDNAGFSQQTNVPVADIKPVFLDGEILVVNNSKTMINAMSFDVNVQNFQFTNISVETNLITSPVQMASVQAPSNNDAQYAIIIEADGTLDTFTALKAQNIAAWAKQITDGKFKQVMSTAQDVWFIVERTINGNTVFYLEKLDQNTLMDCEIDQVFATPTTIITGLSALEGKSVVVIADNARITGKTVSGNQLTLDTAATDVKVGLNFTPKLVPMPPNQNTRTGPNLYEPKHIQWIIIDYYQSLYISVDGSLIDELVIPLDLSTTLQTKTGFQKIAPMGDWDGFSEIEITQTLPYPLTIRAVAMQVLVDQQIEIGG